MKATAEDQLLGCAYDFAVAVAMLSPCYYGPYPHERHSAPEYIQNGRRSGRVINASHI